MQNIKDTVGKYAQEEFFSKIEYILKPQIDQMDNIVISLANDKVVEDFILTKKSSEKEELQNLFLTMTNSHKLIMQTRLLDANGKELIRVDRENEQSLPFIVKDSNLQDKHLRDYFQDVSKMNIQTVWHSQMDLNIEHGKVEVPYKPTIRISMPIFKEKKFVGMVICNMLIKKLLQSIEESSMFDAFIIDKDGNYILHSNDKYAFNKYTGIKHHLYEDFPNTATAILSGKAIGEDFYAYSLKNLLHNSDDAILILKPEQDTLNSLRHNNITATIIVTLLSILFSIPLAMYASYTPSRLQQALLNSNTELKRFADIIDKYVITATTNLSGIITSVSSAFAKVSGFSKEELNGQKMNIVRHRDTPKELFENLWKTILKGEQWEGEIKNISKYSNVYWLDQTIIPIKDEDDSIVAFMSFGIEVTDKKKLEILAFVDKLTNLYNRRKVDECLYLEVEKSKRYKKTLSVIMMDIDHFKKINDTYGHQTGDIVLQKVGDIITVNTRKIDCCGRFGGEEFLIICPETAKEGAYTLADQIRVAIEKSLFEVVNHITISLGVASYEGEDDTMVALLKRSDEALYKAKAGGRNKTIVL